MAGSLNTKSYLKKYKARSKWHRALTCMAALVVFCTTYALVLPALTLERPTVCGMEEHIHTVACYADSGSELLCQGAIALHEHDESCFDESGAVICGYSDTGLHQHDDSCYNEEQELICGYADFVLHTHDDTCYNADGTLRCPLPEIEYYTVKQPKESGLLDGILGELFHADSTTGSALDYTADGEPAAEDGAEADIEYEEIQITEPHTHDDSCFELEDGTISDVPVCGLLEVQVHTHTAACMADEPLICELEEHQHSEACYEAEAPQYICGQAEHQHGEDCYDAEGNVICEKEEHSHSDSCLAPAEEQEQPEQPQYICGLDEHQHGEDCYDAEGKLICKKEEHSHSDSCLAPAEEQEQPEQPAEPQYICGLEEHQHGEDCYDEAGQEICGKTAHSHDESCLAPVKEQEPALTFSGDDYTVSIHYDSEAGIPENARLQVEEITADTEEYASCYQQIVDTVSDQATAYAMLDVEAETDTAVDVEAAPEIVPQVAQERFFNINLMADDQPVALQAPVEVKLQLNNAAMPAEECTVVECTEEIVQVAEMADVQSVQNGANTLTATFQTRELGTYGILALSTTQSKTTTDDTLESVARKDGQDAYSLEYLLTQYNIISFGDVEMNNHTKGGFLIKGGLSGSGSDFAGATAVTAPSYIQGYVDYGGQHKSAGDSIKQHTNVYVGTVNTITMENGDNGYGLERVNGKQLNPWGKVYITDYFVDWNKLESIVRVTSEEMAQKSNVFKKASNTWETIEIQTGSRVTLDMGECPFVYINITGDEVLTTVITFEGEYYKAIPRIKFNNQEINGSEDAQDMPIVLNFPNATNIDIGNPSVVYGADNTVIGHILAPNATVNVFGGNYNGCIVCKNAVVNGEGHIWPYSGITMVPTQNPFRVTKFVNGKTPTDGEKFKFHLEKLDFKDSAGPWVELETKENNRSEVKFSKITYDKAGAYWYQISENRDQKPSKNYVNSTAQYLVEVIVKETQKDGTTIYYVDKTNYYQVKRDENGDNLDPLGDDGYINKERLKPVATGAAHFNNIKIGDNKTTIEVNKQWFDSNENNITGSKKGSISFDLYRVASTTPTLTSTPSHPNVGSKIGTYRISDKTDWHWSSETAKDAFGDKLVLLSSETEINEDEEPVTIYYTYYIEEAASENYTTSYENNSGIASGTIIIRNTETEQQMVLPEAGGSGVQWYTLTGLLLMGTALGLYRRQKTSRKGEL